MAPSPFHPVTLMNRFKNFAAVAFSHFTAPFGGTRVLLKYTCAQKSAFRAANRKKAEERNMSNVLRKRLRKIRQAKRYTPEKSTNVDDVEVQKDEKVVQSVEVEDEE